MTETMAEETWLPFDTVEVAQAAGFTSGTLSNGDTFGDEDDPNPDHWLYDARCDPALFRSEIERLQARNAELEKLVYVPGLWRCAKCEFQLIQANLNANDGSVTARDKPGDKCPNCDSPLWRVTEREAGNKVIDDSEKHFARLQARVAELEKPRRPEDHKLDTETQVFFYEQDFYVLSNFSAFTLEWRGRRFDTSEAAYHWEKFFGTGQHGIQEWIQTAPSAHEAFKIAERNKHLRRDDWDSAKISVMRAILREKVEQHEYVRRKLLATGDRELIEDSWRDDFWGWGPNRDGKNMLGKLWMEVRAEARAILDGASKS